MSNLLSTGLVLALISFGGTNTPPGTIHLNNNLYFDQSEISNISWMEYIFWLKKEYGENSEEYRDGLPDNEIWKEVYNTDFSITINHEYANCPVVGISHKQANDFCKWRTDRVNEKYGDKFLVEYRLPSEVEFLEAIAYEKKETDQYFNEKFNIYNAPSKTKGGYLLFLSNNVSEMTNADGKAFGGNYFDKSNAIKEYNAPEKWLGFRCVAEIKK